MKDGANVTQIEQGSELTITWHLGYVHGVRNNYFEF